VLPATPKKSKTAKATPKKNQGVAMLPKGVAYFFSKKATPGNT